MFNESVESPVTRMSVVIPGADFAGSGSDLNILFKKGFTLHSLVKMGRMVNVVTLRIDGDIGEKQRKITQRYVWHGICVNSRHY
ncbi:MAG: hypothetical protein WBN88_10275 [Anderseniella sp.]